MKAFFTLSILSTALFFISCERCAECTSVSTDPFTVGDTLTAEFCEKGHIYDNELESYEKRDWDCNEK
jgi:hypothetical protein